MNLFFKEAWDLKYRFLFLIALLIGLGYFILAHYDYFLRFVDITQIEAALRHSILVRYLPPELLIEQIQQLMKSIDLYVWSQWFGKNFYQIILLGIILLGFSTFARENENDTNSFLLSNLTRGNVFLTKISVGISMLIVLILIGCSLPAILAPYYEYSFSWALVLKYSLQMTIVSIFLYGLVILLSIISKDVIWPIIGSIIFFILLSVPGRIEALQQLHVYSYMVGTNIFFLNTIAIAPMIVIAILTVMLFYLNLYIYSKKNF
ncbi:hypothetical protein SYNTR_2118 [Candidatus Syntrophocurvum alkaliphilum]|uniref:Uncharacterized protein n=1 Tax=Candidatus Syntrophocurvum alkaliphilum TaxID=2293317 RepID=A0A6I6DE10_9FIRM|nr:hypothetical protein [Candidatus Syntrophocurvum alkaliphilum]QGU00712.1 hypothetical protein SYNTR_2118 [Candidatus Syntrophocurvum alkaliphilum]